MKDDTISRQEAINALYELYHHRPLDYGRIQMRGDILNTIINLPSAERRGRWIKDKNLYKCTVCNDLLTVAGWADCISEKQIYTAFKYCPHCGAKMVSEDEEISKVSEMEMAYGEYLNG